MPAQTIDATKAKQWLEKNEAILVDVREPAEHATKSIPQALSKPLGSVSCDMLPKDKKIILHCQKGKRGENACEKLLAENSSLEVYNLEGGIESWEQAGLPTESSGKNTLPLDRQVQLAIGLSVLLFSLLGYFVHPDFIFAAAFFGAGLTFAGITGFCGLARFMSKMPWNQ